LGQESNSSAKPQVVQNDKHTKVKSVPKKIQEKKVVTKKTIVENVKKIEKKIEEPKLKKSRQDNKENVFLAYRAKRAKLVIIIDDVHTQAQINAIEALNMKVTPSIFPPYKSAPESHLLARGLKHYMVHLPMESGNVKFNTQYKTLKTSFNKKKIQSRVKEIRTLFPEAKYINNHTGSVFTANYEAMTTLYVALRKEGFVFIDSRTTASSQVRKIAHGFGDVYVARDTFIDNVHTVPAIHKQLTQAVKLAKKNGYAVVIGHPHSTTMEALGSAKTIFKDIDLVYIDEIYR
jgi:polysaccharide deacetylase 2 family uncharacterized protein YibQ